MRTLAYPFAALWYLAFAWVFAHDARSETVRYRALAKAACAADFTNDYVALIEPDMALCRRFLKFGDVVYRLEVNTASGALIIGRRVGTASRWVEVDRSERIVERWTMQAPERPQMHPVDTDWAVFYERTGDELCEKLRLSCRGG